MVQLTYTHAELATVLQTTPARFSNRRRALEAHGFPRALPGLGAIWSKPQVDAWIAGNGDLQSPEAVAVAEVAVAEARADLEQEYCGAPGASYRKP